MAAPCCQSPAPARSDYDVDCAIAQGGDKAHPRSLDHAKFDLWAPLPEINQGRS
jgi:hypothetical protein